MSVVGMGYSRKNLSRWRLRIYFSGTSPGIFNTVFRNSPEKISFHPWKLCKIVWHTLEIARWKTETHGNSTWIFLEHPWKFHFLFNWPLEFPHALSSIPLKIPWPQIFHVWCTRAAQFKYNVNRNSEDSSFICSIGSKHNPHNSMEWNSTAVVLIF